MIDKYSLFLSGMFLLLAEIFGFGTVEDILVLFSWSCSILVKLSGFSISFEDMQFFLGHVMLREVTLGLLLML